MLEHLESLRQMPRDLTENFDKANALIFKSGLSRADVSALTSISIPRVHSIYRGGIKELERVTPATLITLAQGYDKLVIELDKF